jgi:hypothetical protein
MDREKWSTPITLESAPAYPCPHCKPGTIHFVKGSLNAEESPASKEAQSHEAWDPDWVTEHFHCSFRCSNPSCLGWVYVVGSASYQEVGHSEAESKLERRLEPSFFIPAPRIINVPLACPDEVVRQVDAASSLFWSDPAAAGNRLRSAIEAVLTEQGVSRSSPTTQSGTRLKHRRRLGLPERVERLKSKHPELAERLHAIRWVGNEASHSAELTKSDVLDAFEILESVLADLYAKKAEKLKAIVTQINRKKRPRSSRRRRKAAFF